MSTRTDLPAPSMCSPQLLTTLGIHASSNTQLLLRLSLIFQYCSSAELQADTFSPGRQTWWGLCAGLKLVRFFVWDFQKQIKGPGVSVAPFLNNTSQVLVLYYQFNDTVTIPSILCWIRCHCHVTSSTSSSFYKELFKNIFFFIYLLT